MKQKSKIDYLFNQCQRHLPYQKIENLSDKKVNFFD